MHGSNAPKINIGILNYNEGLMRRCLINIKETVKTPHRFILIDNGGLSEEYIDDLITEDSIIIEGDEKGFVNGFNKLINVIKNDFIFINVDMMVRDNTLDKLNQLSKTHKDFGIISTVEYKPYTDIKSTRTGKKLSKISNDLFTMEWVAFGCIFFRYKMVVDVGLLDDNFYFWFCDLDYCKKAIKKGWKIGLAQNISVYHEGQKSYNEMRKNKNYIDNLKKDKEHAEELGLLKIPEAPIPHWLICKHKSVLVPIKNTKTPPFYQTICVKCKEVLT